MKEWLVRALLGIDEQLYLAGARYIQLRNQIKIEDGQRRRKRALLDRIAGEAALRVHGGAKDQPVARAAMEMLRLAGTVHRIEGSDGRIHYVPICGRARMLEKLNEQYQVDLVKLDLGIELPYAAFVAVDSK